MIRIALPAPVPVREDFKTWQRENLERFARQAADENKQLRDNLRVAIDAYRQLVVAQAPKEVP